jgi:hypothetical protein
MNIMDSLSPEEKQELRGMRIFFIAVVTLVAVFLLGSIVFNQVSAPVAPQLASWKNWLLGGTAIFSAICAVQGKLRFSRAIESAKTSLNPLAGKLRLYKNALIAYLATTELPVLLSIILSIITGNFVFQVYAAVLFGFMLSAMPRAEKVINQLQ